MKLTRLFQNNLFNFIHICKTNSSSIQHIKSHHTSSIYNNVHMHRFISRLICTLICLAYKSSENNINHHKLKVIMHHPSVTMYKCTVTSPASYARLHLLSHMHTDTSSITIIQYQSSSSYNHMLCMLMLVILCHFHCEALL